MKVLAQTDSGVSTQAQYTSHPVNCKIGTPVECDPFLPVRSLRSGVHETELDTATTSQFVYDLPEIQIQLMVW